jgi:hypothetical protein
MVKVKFTLEQVRMAQSGIRGIVLSTRNIPGGKAENLTTFTCRMSLKSGSLKLLEPSGPHRVCYGTPVMPSTRSYGTSVLQGILSACSHSMLLAVRRRDTDTDRMLFIALPRREVMARCADVKVCG